MIKFHRLWKYLLVYVLLLIITAVFTVEKIIRPIDLAVYKEFYLKSDSAKKYKDEFLDKGIDKVNKEINEKFIFIDIPTENWPKGTFLKNLRRHEADLLKTIDSMIPVEMSEMDKPVIILDITFKSDDVGLDYIYEAMWPLIEKNIKVYASYKLPDEDEVIKYEDHDEKQAYPLYDDYFTSGRLNTYFYSHKKVNGLASYYSFEVLDDTIIKSLPVQIAKDLGFFKEEIDLRNQNIYPLPLKLPFDSASIKDNYYVFTNDSSLTANNNFSKIKDSINLIKKFIIVGTPEDKQHIGDYEVPGPYIVAIALIDQLNGNEFTKSAHENIIVQLTLIIFFPFIVCLFFMVIYKYIKKLQTYPALIALISWILGVITLIILGLILLEFVVIRPTFPILSMVYVSILTWHFTKQFLVLGIMEGSGEFDVFISYSRSKSDWVKKYLLKPLEEIKKPDGSELKIFFDEKSIGIGEHFTTKYMRSIIDSKFFIPVMSEDYYGKNHCRNEMDIAVKRNVEKLMEMLIVALDYKFVPEEFNHINFIEAKSGIDLMGRIKKELIKVESETTNGEINVEEINHNSEQSISESPLESKIEASEEQGIQEKIIDNSEQKQLETVTSEPSEKDEIEIIDKKEKKRSDNKDKISEKQAKKEKEKKDKKSSKKKDKKEKEKQAKKEQEKKAKKRLEKKAKKEQEKQAKKEQKKKDKKRLEKQAKKEQKKKAKKHSEKKGKKENKKKNKKS